MGAELAFVTLNQRPSFVLRATGGKPRSCLTFDSGRIGLLTCRQYEQRCPFDHLVGGTTPFAEARISFDAYFDLGEIDKAKRLREKYLKPEPGDADPDTGAITLGNWG